MGEKKIVRYVFLILLSILILCSANVYSATIIINPSADAMVRQQFPNTNYGTNTTIIVGKYETSNYNYGYLKFQTSSIPTGQTIYSAMCNFNIYSSVNNGGYLQMHICKAMSNSWSEESITWNNQPGISPDPCISGPQWTGPAPLGYRTYNCTNYFSSAYNSGRVDLSLVLEPGSTSNGNYLNIYSKEWGYQNQKPYIAVDYYSTIYPVTLFDPSNINQNSMTLSWTQYSPQSDFQKYELHRSTTGGFTPGPSTLVTTIYNLQTTTYVDSGLNSNTTYYYKVRVYNTYNALADSNQVSGRTFPSCTAGWICYNATTRGYRNSDCSWGQLVECSPNYVCSNSVCIQNPNLPQISNIIQTPSQVTQNDVVNISATVTDPQNDITLVNFVWDLNHSGSWTTVVMNNQGGNLYKGSFGPFAQNSMIRYQVQAWDPYGYTLSNFYEFNSSQHFRIIGNAPSQQIATNTLLYLEEAYTKLAAQLNPTWQTIYVNFTYNNVSIGNLSMSGTKDFREGHHILILEYGDRPITDLDLRRASIHEFMHILLDEKAPNWKYNEGLAHWAPYAVYNLRSAFYNDSRISDGFLNRYNSNHDLLNNFNDPINPNSNFNWQIGAAEDFWVYMMKNETSIFFSLVTNYSNNNNLNTSLLNATGINYEGWVYDWKSRYPGTCTSKNNCMPDDYVGYKYFNASINSFYGIRKFRNWTCSIGGTCTYTDHEAILESVGYLPKHQFNPGEDQCNSDYDCENQEIHENCNGRGPLINKNIKMQCINPQSSNSYCKDVPISNWQFNNWA
ncbi:MAG: DNRLRE domain-containing protein, partial [Candidatus Woesearchaeota archaeon]